MQKAYRFSTLSSNDHLLPLKKECLAQLSSPPDGMWEAFRNGATHIEILEAEQLIGFACIDDQKQLIQFYLRPQYLGQGSTIFQQFISEFDLKKGIVGTNNPLFLSIVLAFTQQLAIHTYLFRDHYEAKPPKKGGNLKKARLEDLQKIVDFCHFSLGAPKEWLTAYFNELIGKGEVFFLEERDKIIGTCEVRRNASAPECADIGMIVSPDFRRQAYGTFLLNEAKSIALDWGKKPICSCEKENTGSIKAIHHCGFISKYQLLSITFS